MTSHVKDQKPSEGTPAPKSSSFFGFNFFEFSEGFQLNDAEKNAMSEDNSDDDSDETSDSCSSDEETISSDETGTGTDTDTYSNSDTHTADDLETSALMVRNQRGCINAILGSNDGYGASNDEKTVEDMNSYVYEPPIALSKKRALLPGRVNKYSMSQDKEQDQANKLEPSVDSFHSVTNNDTLFKQLFSTEVPAKNVEPPVEKNVSEMEQKKPENKTGEAAATQNSKRKRWRLFQRKKKDIPSQNVTIPGKLPQARSSKKKVSRQGISEKRKPIGSQDNAIQDTTTSDAKDATVKETVGSFEQSFGPYLALSNIFYKNDTSSKEPEKDAPKSTLAEFREERNSILEDSFSCSVPADRIVKREASEASKTIVTSSKSSRGVEKESDNLVKIESTKSMRKESSNQLRQEDKLCRALPKSNMQVEKRDDDQDLYASILEHIQREQASSTKRSIPPRRSSKPPLSPKLRRPPRPDVPENARLPPLRSKLQILPKSSTRASSARGMKTTETRPVSSASSSSRMDQTIQGKRYISQAHLYPENLSFGDEYSDFDDWFSLGSMNPY